MVGTLVRGCRCATSWCDLDLTFDLPVVTLTGLYLGNRKVLAATDYYNYAFYIIVFFPLTGIPQLIIFTAS